MARLISIVGRKDAGKTTLAVALVGELRRRGHRVMTMKHGHHPVDADRVGSDTWRHFNEGQAERTLIAGPSLRVLFERADDDYDPVGLARRYLADADIVVVEGFSRAPLPKIEVWRTVVNAAPLLDEAAEPERWVALVADERRGAPCPVLTFGDTNWLQALGALAWHHAAELSP